MKLITIILVIWLAVLSIYWKFVARDATAQTLNDPATLDVLLDGPDLFIDFDVPAVELMGFGHAPQNSQEHNALVEAHRLLDSGTMIEPSASAKCTLTESFAIVGHGYDDLCSSDSSLPKPVFSDDLASSNLAANLIRQSKGKPAEISARWAWTCERPSSLRTLDVNLFTGFSHLSGISVNTDGASTDLVSHKVWPTEPKTTIIRLDSNLQ